MRKNLMRQLLIVFSLFSFTLVLLPSLAYSTAAIPVKPSSIRFIDLTGTENAWYVGRTAAIQASKGKKVVIVSHLDSQTTQILYNVALSFVAKKVPVAGFIRSPAASPAQRQQTPSSLEFDVYFDGIPLLPGENPGQQSTHAEQLATILGSILQPQQ